MNLKKLTIAPMLALALFAVGCGADCESLCEDGNECPKEEGEKDVDCGKFCEDLEKMNEKTGCEDQYDDALSCASDVDDVCKPGNACDAEQKKYGDCVAKACAANPSDCT